MPAIPIPLLTVGLLVLSNLFMTVAWYWHLKYKMLSLPLVVLISWGLAFFEYCFQVPANRWGYGYFTAVQLKVIQELVTLSVFALFSAYYLDVPLKWNHYVGFAMMCASVFVVFKEW